MTPSNYLEYVRYYTNDVPTDELQVIYTLLSGLTKESLELRVIIRKELEKRV